MTDQDIAKGIAIWGGVFIFWLLQAFVGLWVVTDNQMRAYARMATPSHWQSRFFITIIRCYICTLAAYGVLWGLGIVL